MAWSAPDFRSTVEQHQRMVFSIAVRVTGEHGVAEEVAQDVFLELYRAADKLESDDHIRFWLRRVTVHRATDAVRRMSRRPESGAEEWMEEQHGGNDDGAVSRTASLEAKLEAKLEELLQTLPEPLRVPIVLRYQEEMTPEEIAELLRQPLATVKSHLQRGLRLLRRKAEVTMKEYVR